MLTWVTKQGPDSKIVACLDSPLLLKTVVEPIFLAIILFLQFFDKLDIFGFDFYTSKDNFHYYESLLIFV